MECIICGSTCDRKMSYAGKQYPMCLPCFNRYANLFGFGSNFDEELNLARFSESRRKISPPHTIKRIDFYKE